MKSVHLEPTWKLYRPTYCGRVKNSSRPATTRHYDEITCYWCKAIITRYGVAKLWPDDNEAVAAFPQSTGNPQ